MPEIQTFGYDREVIGVVQFDGESGQVIRTSSTSDLDNIAITVNLDVHCAVVQYFCADINHQSEYSDSADDYDDPVSCRLIKDATDGEGGIKFSSIDDEWFSIFLCETWKNLSPGEHNFGAEGSGTYRNIKHIVLVLIN